MSSSDRLQLVPLSTQKEGDSWLVGSVELNCFFQMPDIAVQIIRLLQQGLLLSEVKAHLQAAGDGDFDLDDFAATLIEIGLAYRGDSPARTAPPVAPSARWLASAAKVGQVIFSWPGACLYLLVIGYAALCAVRAPRILPPLHVFYFPGHLTASLLLLLVFYFVMVMLHEMGHMLAAARVGIDSHLGVGTRLWTIVMEADLTGVLSLPRRQRYLPLLAGLVVDVLNVSILLIAVSHLMAVHASPFLIQLLQALTMQILLSMSWQGNVFLRTDLYYVLCNALAYPDLDRDARLYFRSLLFMVSGGRLGVDLPEGQRPWRIAILRLFSIVWFVGRVGSLYLLFAAAGPTLLRYAVDDYHALTTASAAALPWDYIIFTVLSASMLAAGIWMWLAQMKSRKLTLAGQQ
ncbi:MAG TPA: hypothetical protein VE783_10805 [Candidatus Limnocylindrales bacterium]|nr:hypothetical protein [Candidatus Limnocylindrales bacterium]